MFSVSPTAVPTLWWKANFSRTASVKNKEPKGGFILGRVLWKYVNMVAARMWKKLTGLDAQTSRENPDWETDWAAALCWLCKCGQVALEQGT